MPEPETSYFFNLSERGVFSEIYFPKRAAYHGAIFDALRFGYDESNVKEYLCANVEKILNEFKSFPDLFNPHRYTITKLKRIPVSIQEALERIDMYKSMFKGWTIYSVDGVWFNEKKESPDYGKPIEEATQIVRVMFRFESSLTEEAIAKNCLDVFRSILFWVISLRGRLEDYKAWSKREKAQYMLRHKFWPKRKLLFAEQNFVKIATEVGKWIDDRLLFVFAYLVRKFWKRVEEEGLTEEEIWVTNFYDLVLNVVKKT